MSDELNETMEAMDLTTKPEEKPVDVEDVVDPWNVTSTSEKGIDYEKLISLLKFTLITVIKFFSLSWNLFFV